MKKILFIFMCLILSGCVYPKFHSHTQSISFKYPHLLNDPNTMVFKLDGQYNIKRGEVVVDRSFSSLKATLSKKGFEDKQIEIKSHFTDDKWALGIADNEEEVSAVLLLPLACTLNYTALGIIGGASFPVEENGWKGVFLTPFTSVVGAVTGFSVGFANDVRNLFTLSFPRAIFGNPWYEYDKEIDLTREILTPTPEFEKECYSKKNTFIGNNDCLTCLTEREVIATEEECNRCSNREWSNFECRLK